MSALIDPRQQRRPTAAAVKGALPPTRRQYEVLAAVCRYGGTFEAAQGLGISAHTISSNLSAIYQRLGTTSLIGTVTKLGWLTVPECVTEPAPPKVLAPLVVPRHGNAKLSDADLVEIRAELANYRWGIQTALARRFGVSHVVISNIAAGRAHKAAA